MQEKLPTDVGLDGIIPSTVSPTYLTYIRNCYNINIIYYAGKTTHRCGTGQESSPLLFPPTSFT